MLLLVLVNFLLVELTAGMPERVASMNVTDYVIVPTIGLQQCKKMCLSYRDCEALAYHKDSITCYLRQGTIIGGAAGIISEVFYQERSDMLNGSDDFNATAGSICVTLSSENVVCLGSPCGDPPKVENATLKSDSTIINYTCDDPTINKTGVVKRIICQANGQWTTPELVCSHYFVVIAPVDLLLTHDEAIAYCSARNARLIHVRSIEEGNALINEYNISGHYHTDAGGHSGTWKFSDGSLVDPSFFAVGEAEQYSNEPCSYIPLINQQANKLMTAPCGGIYKYRVMCEAY